MRHTEILKELDITGVGQAISGPTQDISDREGDERKRQQKIRGLGYNIFVADFMDKVRKMLDAKLPLAPAAAPGAAAGRPQKPQIDQQMDDIISQMRQLQSTAGNKPVPPEMAKSIAADMKYVATNKDYFNRVGARILDLAKRKYDVTNLHTQFMAQARLGKRNKTIQEQRLTFIYLKLLNETSILEKLRQAGYNPAHIFKVVSKKLNETRAYIQATDILLESSPHNDESLMEVGLPTTRVQPDQPGVGTWPPEKIEEYLLANLPRVLKLDQSTWSKGLTQRVQGVPGAKSMAELIKDLSNEYAQDKGAKTLPQLAQVAYAISQVSPEEQARGEYGGASGGGTAAASGAAAPSAFGGDIERIARNAKLSPDTATAAITQILNSMTPTDRAKFREYMIGNRL